MEDHPTVLATEFREILCLELIVPTLFETLAIAESLLFYCGFKRPVATRTNPAREITHDAWADFTYLGRFVFIELATQALLEVFAGGDQAVDVLEIALEIQQGVVAGG